MSFEDDVRDLASLQPTQRDARKVLALERIAQALEDANDGPRRSPGGWVPWGGEKVLDAEAARELVREDQARGLIEHPHFKPFPQPGEDIV